MNLYDTPLCLLHVMQALAPQSLSSEIVGSQRWRLWDTGVELPAIDIDALFLQNKQPVILLLPLGFEIFERFIARFNRCKAS